MRALPPNRWPVLLALALAFPVVAARAEPAAPGAQVVSFSPRNEIRTVRQVQVRFSTPMVRFGDPRLADPFTATCASPGKGRWLDPRNWVYDFNEDLPSGIACHFDRQKDLRALDGQLVKGEARYDFNTGGPQVTDSRPIGGISYSRNPTLFLIKANRDLRLAWRNADQGIEENPHFMLKLDGEVDRRLIESNAFCQAQGIHEQIPVHLLTESETIAYVSQLDIARRAWWDSNHPGWMTAVQRKPVSKLILTCRRQLPNSARVFLVWGHGIASPTGIANTADELLAFRVRPEFTASFSCQRESARKPCNPLTDMHLEFVDRVSADILQNIELRDNNGKVWHARPNAQGDDYEDGNIASFKGPFPVNSTLSLHLPDTIKGVDTERPLKNAARFPLTVKVGDYPPLAKFTADFGIVESAVGAVPLTLRNLEPDATGSNDNTAARLLTLRLPDDDAGVIAWLKKAHQFENQPWGTAPANDDNDDVDNAKATPAAPATVDPRGTSLLRDQPGVTDTALPKPEGAKAFEVIGIPVPVPGVYLHEVESRYLGRNLLGQDKPMYVHSMSLVTDLAVHFKRGNANSLVWVTSLEQATPVAGAHVEVHDCNAGELLWSGDTDKDGIARIGISLPAMYRSDIRQAPGQKALAHAASCAGASMLVSARSGRDRGFVLSDWSAGIEPWRYNLRSFFPQDADDDASGDDTYSAHTVLDRSLLKPGETVHMRYFLRSRTLRGFTAPDHLPTRVFVRQVGSNQDYDIATRFDAEGNAEGEWKIPAAAKLGSYTVIYAMKTGAEIPAGTFRVAQYRLPLLKARLQVPAGPIAYPSTLPADMSLAYLNGGGFGGARVTLRGLVTEAFVGFPDYDNYSFRTCVDAVGQDLCPPLSRFEQPETLEEAAATLDDNGGGREDVTLPTRVNPADVHMEMEFRDPSGETQTVAANTQYWPASLIPGIKVDSWLKPGKGAPVDIIVLDTKGKKVRGAPVRVDAFLDETISTREKTVGGFYAYSSHTELKALPASCKGKSDAEGRLHCSISVHASGHLRLRAVVTDAQGKEGTSSADAWLSGDNPWWFEQNDTDRIDVIPEKKEYAPGDTMRMRVQSPFPEATALVTVEREGILDASVQHVSSKSPSVTLPAKGDYAPNVFVSTLLVRGRDDSVQPTALIDLGKPSFKEGITEVRVGWDAFRLGVKIDSDKKRYRIREHAKVHVQVSPPTGSPLPAGTEVTIAVVDEALLELAANNSWNLLHALMGDRTLEVATATSQIEVVGKRHFGRKALPPGGGGGHGRGSSRELLDTLIYWKARATLNSDGSADFDVPLNDSLSGFRLVAVASSRDRFGTGQNSIQTYQDLQVISGLPLLVRQGDAFVAGFTVRNAGKASQTIAFSAEAPALGMPPLQQTLTLAPGTSQALSFNVTVPRDVQRIDWTINARSNDASDSLKTSQTVLDPVPEQVIQGTLTQIDPAAPFTLPVRKPADALAGGGIDVSLRAHLGDGLDGVTRFFRHYPYSCLEQQVSRAIALDDKDAWQSISENLPAYLDDQGFAKIFTSLEHGDPLITAYLLEVVDAKGWALPAAPRQRMLDALNGYVSGKLSPPVWNFAPLDSDARKLKALGVLARYHRFTPALLSSISIQPQNWPTAMVLDWIALLQTVTDLPGRADSLRLATDIVRSRLIRQGTAQMLSRKESNQWWLYDSIDVDSVRLFLAAQTLPDWKDDLPSLINGLALRSTNGHWDTTLANAWATIAMQRFSERFEKTPVTGTTALSLGATQKSVPWPVAGHDPVRLDWPVGPADLRIRQEGTGTPWAVVQSTARIKVTSPWTSGYRVSKQLRPLLQKVPGHWSVGDVAMVLLDIDAENDMGWVVVEDPIPAGSSLLGRGLNRDSELFQNQGANEAAWMGYWREPDFAEYKQDAFRGYYARVNKGQLATVYMIRFNQAGTFALPPTRVEAMYASDMFGLLPNADFTVEP